MTLFKEWGWGESGVLSEHQLLEFPAFATSALPMAGSDDDVNISSEVSWDPAHAPISDLARNDRFLTNLGAADRTRDYPLRNGKKRRK